MSRSTLKFGGSTAGHLTKQQFVYTTLRQLIIRCDLAPGARLVIDELARQFHVSIIPVREALRLLQSEGLVVSVAHVGATVAPISHASVVEVFTLLEGLEVVAGRAAAERATETDLAMLADLVAEMDRALEAGSPLHWAEINTQFHLSISRLAGMPILQEMNTEFHLAISRIADMPILQDMMQRAVDYWDRVRRYYFRDVLIHRTRLAQAEHRTMLAHMRARDLAGLEQTIREHNRSALAAYTAHLEGSDAVKRERHA
jgi:DNA-binding GntR family transcriptional regulator